MFHHTELTDDLLKKLDVMYVTRIQKERFPDLQEYKKIQGLYTIDENILKRSKLMLQFYIRYQELMKYPHLSITLKMLYTSNRLLMAKSCDPLFYLHCFMKIHFNLS